MYLHIKCFCLLLLCLHMIRGARPTRHGKHAQVGSLLPPFCWVLGQELRLPGLCGKHLGLLRQPAGSDACLKSSFKSLPKCLQTGRFAPNLTAAVFFPILFLFFDTKSLSLGQSLISSLMNGSDPFTVHWLFVSIWEC